MDVKFYNKHLKRFLDISYRPAGVIGVSPSKWTRRHRLPNPPDGNEQLPSHRLDRNQVREICHDERFSLLFRYMCVMAWGSQGQLCGGTSHVLAAWGARSSIEACLRSLTSEQHTRESAYSLFLGGNKILGIGPAYFTKLLYFFSPQPTFYIMDQWTSKSVNLLTGRTVVKLAGGYVANSNDGTNYAEYCDAVDSFAKLAKVSGQQLEEMLMSKGGRSPWPWRAYLKSHTW